MAKILLVTDAWHPQVNGVVTTLSNLVAEAKKNSDTIHVFHPGRCKIRFRFPLYPEITIGIPSPIVIRKLLKKQKWDYIHIATPEAPVGMMFARTCRRLNIPFSTSCHTKFPEFVNSKFPFISVDLGWKYMKRVYQDSTVILTTTDSMVEELKLRGFEQKIAPWTRGVDRNIFYPEIHEKHEFKYPVLVCVSRVSEEKNLDAFCKIETSGTKIIVGSGPYLEKLQKKYSDVIFVGKKLKKDLSYYYQIADVFIFPSKTDTFGVVSIEALACGTPVVAFNVTGPKDIIENSVTGYLIENDSEFSVAIKKTLELNRTIVYNESLKWSWENCYKQFIDILLPAKE
jgi:glycosyltransferase involved in cell wall biosynthesis